MDWRSNGGASGNRLSGRNFHDADGTKNQAVVRESGAGDTAASGNYVNSADAADQVSVAADRL